MKGLGRQAQPGFATGQSVLAWRLGYAEIFYKTLLLIGWPFILTVVPLIIGRDIS
jgi:hypothetical protein